VLGGVPPCRGNYIYLIESGMKGGLRALYRTLELPGANPLKDAHAAPGAGPHGHAMVQPSACQGKLELTNFIDTAHLLAFSSSHPITGNRMAHHF